MSGLVAVGMFLLTLFFSLVLFFLWARVFLRFCKVSSLHPVSQLINTFSSPLTKPFSRLMAFSKPSHAHYDWPCFAVIVLVEIIKFLLFGLLLYGVLLPFSYLLLFVIADLIIQPCNLLFYLILLRVIMSWVNPIWQHPVADAIKKVTEPLLQLARKYVPYVSGFDFSPFVVMLILKIITLFISVSLPLRLI